MKPAVLHAIYEVFEAWAAHLEIACRQGCSTCCTQNVTVTALEAELIVSHCQADGGLPWLRERLEGLPVASASLLSTNEFARACLEHLEVDPGQGSFDRPCPFLDADSCTIYPVRPFGCRSFISARTCKQGGCAAVPHYYMAATTAVNQLIEHLDQGRPWGNLLQVLVLLTGPNSEDCHSGPPGPEQLAPARSSCRTAQPLPGFLLGEADYRLVAPLLERIFSATVNGITIEAILNRG